ncbi:MAG: Flp pilus assembly protein CpaB, partial [Panacagrimonas sp.]
LVLAVLGWRVSQQYAENSERAQAKVKAQSEQAQVPKILAVIAVQSLSAYQKIPKDAVVLAEVSVAPKDYFTSLEDVVGREPLVDVDQGAPLTRRYFGEGNVLAKSIPPGFQAVSVEVSDVIGVGGFVRPGDMVDVLLYLKGSGDVESSQARVLLENTRVLAYHELLVDRPEGLKEQEQTERNQGRRQRTAVLAVPDKDTTKLMLGASQGELRLALRGLTPPGSVVAAAGTPGGDPAAIGALPINAEAQAAEAAKKVPEKAITLEQLSRIQSSPAERKKTVVRQSVIIYRGSEVETTTP